MPALFVELDLSGEAQALRAFQLRGMPAVKPYDNISRVFFPGRRIWLLDAPLGERLATFASIPGVLYLEPDEEHIYSQPLRWRDTYPFGTPNISLGPVSLAQLPEDSLREIGKTIGAGEAHRQGYDGTGVVVLIVDSGINGSRIPASLRVGGWTDQPEGDPWKDEFGHGTMVAMIAHSVAPGAGIFSVKVRPGPQGGIMKESVMSALDALVPVVEENPGLRLVMNASWGTAGCEGEPYW